MSESPAKSDPLPGTNSTGQRVWLGKLSTYLASFAGGAAVNDLSGTLGYHGLAGAIALLAVVTAATWIRGLDPRARLPRRASWLFLAPAACVATVAAFSSGTAASILTAVAAILTVGAILIAKELQSAMRLLSGAAFIVAGAALIAGCAASIADGNTPLGAAIIPGGAVFIAAGIAYIGYRDTLAGAALIVAGTVFIVAGATVIATGAPVSALGPKVIGIALIFWCGVLFIAEGRALITSDRKRRMAARYGARLKRAGVQSTASSAAVYAVLTAALADEASPTARAERLRAAVSPVMAAMLACGAAFLASGAKVTKGVTLAGAAHMGARDALILVAFVAAVAAYGAWLVMIIGPHNIVARARQVIEWATKPPQSAEKYNAEHSTPHSDANLTDR